MLVFGPYQTVINLLNENSVVFNLSSYTEDNSIYKLYPLLPLIDTNNIDIRQLDDWYYNYLLNDIIAFNCLMLIMDNLYIGKDVFILIGSSQNGYAETITTLLIDFIFDRYGYRSAIINVPEDLDSFGPDLFMFNVYGIQNLDIDRNRYIQSLEEDRIKNGGFIDVY